MEAEVVAEAANIRKLDVEAETEALYVDAEVEVFTSLPLL